MTPEPSPLGILLSLRKLPFDNGERGTPGVMTPGLPVGGFDMGLQRVAL